MVWPPHVVSPIQSRISAPFTHICAYINLLSVSHRPWALYLLGSVIHAIPGD